MSYFIVVHVGAGNHARSKEGRYKKLMKKACKNAIAALSTGEEAVSAVAAAITVLENNNLTNAGYGSNLTRVRTLLPVSPETIIGYISQEK